jgi:hypothetical protein
MTKDAAFFQKLGTPPMIKGHDLSLKFRFLALEKGRQVSATFDCREA